MVAPDTCRFRETDCPVCQVRVDHTAFWAVDRLHGLGDRFRYVRCPGCGLLFMNPQVAPESLAAFYPADYAAYGPIDDGSPGATSFAALRRWIENARLDRHVESRLTRASRVLDLGCGSGDFLAKVRQRTGADVVGLDLSPRAVEATRVRHGIEVECSVVESARFEPASFDLITAWYYFEHVSDPTTTLQSVHRLLKSGGRFVLGIPNARSLNAMLFRARWYHLDCPRHLFLWTPASVRRILEREGFAVEDIRYDKTPWGLLGSLQYAVYGTNTDARTGDTIRRNRALSKLLLPPSVLVGLLRLSDIMIVTAERR
jgi:SAM-dependent methyltransferase